MPLRGNLYRQKERGVDTPSITLVEQSTLEENFANQAGCISDVHNNCNLSPLLKAGFLSEPESILFAIKGIPLISILGTNSISSFVFHFSKKFQKSFK